jgi:hypothetical protein
LGRWAKALGSAHGSVSSASIALALFDSLFKALDDRNLLSRASCDTSVRPASDVPRRMVSERRKKVVVVLIFAERGGNAVRCCVGVGGLDVVFIGAFRIY